MKFLFLIADGMGDWPHEAFGNKTALEAAHTPWMDTIAKRGIMGTCRTVPQGMEPGSDVANMALLDFSPQKYHTENGGRSIAKLKSNSLLRYRQHIFRQVLYLNRL